MRDFDRAMQLLDEKFNFLMQGPGYVSRKHEGDKLIAFERGGLLWVFNFHPTEVRLIHSYPSEQPMYNLHTHLHTCKKKTFYVAM